MFQRSFAALIAPFVFLCCGLGFTGRTQAQNIDIKLLRQINSPDKTSMDATFKGVTNSVAPIGVGLPIGTLIYGYAKHDSLAVVKGWQMTLDFGIATAAALTVKYVVHRPRPFDTYPDITKKTDGGGYSFPSGHTADAFTTATSLSIAFPKWYVIVPAYTWAMAVGYSRMYLGVHYPSDVIGGAITGAASAYAGYKIQNWLWKGGLKKSRIITP